MNDLYDVVVIGGGPAGMLAGITASQAGKKVLLLEKNSTLGVKLGITGGGRCNVTNNKLSPKELAKAYGQSEKFLHSLFARYAVKETIDYFSNHGVELVEENEGRLFPSTHKAKTIVDVLVNDLKKSRVEIELGAEVKRLNKNDEGNFVVVINSGKIVGAKNCILATGGRARPETGSTGEGFLWLQKLGHTVKADTLGLVPVLSNDMWLRNLAGVALPLVGLNVYIDNKKAFKAQGKLLFTHEGLSGPGILQISQRIGEALHEGVVSIGIDLFPDKSKDEVRAYLQSILVSESNKKLKNILATIIQTSLVEPLLMQDGISGETFGHSVSRIDRDKLALSLKDFRVRISGLAGVDKAVVAGGGVELAEVNFKTMESKIVPRLFLVGDVLNINRPSGGYSLQLCWSTGYVAGVSSSI